MENIPCLNLLRKLKTFEDRVNFARELCTILFIINRIYFTQGKRVRCQIFFKLYERSLKINKHILIRLAFTYR